MKAMSAFVLAVVAVSFATWSVYAAEPQASITSRSETTVHADGVVNVKRTVTFSAPLAQVLHGSSDIAPEHFAAFLASITRATEAKCDRREDSGTIVLLCNYAYHMEGIPEGDRQSITLKLPGDSLIPYTAPLSVHYPYALDVEERSTIEAPGILLTLPGVVNQRVPTSSWIEQDIRLESMTGLTLATRAHIAPGDGLQNQFAVQAPVAITFALSYFPSPLQWTWFLAAAASVALYISAITPLRRVRRVHRTRLAPLGNFLVGSILSSVGAGLILLGLTWIWAVNLISALVTQIQSLVAFLPIASIREILDALPYILLTLGVLLSGVGAGILRWQDWARRSALVIGYVLSFAVISSTPFLLLLPEWIPFQSIALFAVIELLLLLVIIPLRLFTSPEMRLRYAE